MILCCDPPRHAFLIHFGKRQQSGPIETLEYSSRGARVEIAVSTQSVPPSLVAIHFARHGFRLPFVGPQHQLSTSFLRLESGSHGNRYFFHFSYEAQDCQEWEVHPGLTVLVRELSGSGSAAPGSIEGRPVLQGFVVNQDVLAVDVDMSEFVFEFAVDSLKDVPVTLFVERADA